MSDKLVRLGVSFSPDHEDIITALLYIHTPWGWQDDGSHDGMRRVVIHFDRPEQSTEIEAALQAVSPDIELATDLIDNADWTSAWKQYFTPIAIGTRFVVLPSWLAHEDHGAEPILIEPKMAFGTGHHQTTALCLGALDDLMSAGRIKTDAKFLDLGTGSGILGIAAIKLGLAGQGFDIDQIAIDNALENAALNGVQDKFALGVGSIDAIPATERFDIILANILANPLIDMAEEIVARLARPGLLILSGILREQAERVAQAYMAQGLPAPSISHSQEWALLVFEA